MKTLIRWAAALYPAAWRARYGDEFAALIDDSARWTDLFDIFKGALAMQLMNLNFWKIAAAFTVAGAIVGGAWSLTKTDRYISSAVLRMSEPASASAPEAGLGAKLESLQQDVFSRHSLSGIIQQQDLYREDRKQKPLEDIIQDMRQKDIKVQTLRDGRLLLSFANQDAASAQAGARAVVAAMIQTNLEAGRRGHGFNLEVVQPANLPANSTGPSRPQLLRTGVLLGLLTGLGAGALFTIFRRRKEGGLLRIGGFAAAGMAIGITIALLIPDQFVSTAVLRTGDDQGKLQQGLAGALSAASLQDLIMQHALYPAERRTTPIAGVVNKMRNRDIRVQFMKSLTADGSNVFTVSFTYTDRYKAQMVTQGLVARIMGNVPSEVLDPASIPDGPSWPNRELMALTGLFAGVLLGLAATSFRRAPLATA